MCAMLPCGTIAYIMVVPNHETLRQVRGMLAEVRAKRPLRYVVYDNACALAHHVRQRFRVRQTSVSTQISHLLFILDRWHKQNHTACLNPDAPLFTPEVDINHYPDLKDLNTEINEQINSWLMRFGGASLNMHPLTFRIFVLLLAHLWSDICLDTASLEANFRDTNVPEPPHLKRYRVTPSTANARTTPSSSSHTSDVIQP